MIPNRSDDRCRNISRIYKYTHHEYPCNKYTIFEIVWSKEYHYRLFLSTSSVLGDNIYGN